MCPLRWERPWSVRACESPPKRGLYATAYWVDGIERPTKEQIKEHDRLIRKHTLQFSDDNFDSAHSFDMLQDVLRSGAKLS
jgi:hypothetical protein